MPAEIRVMTEESCFMTGTVVRREIKVLQLTDVIKLRTIR